MQKKDLKLVYKGERNYIHGTDKYEAIVRFMKMAEPEAASGKFRIIFHKFIHHQCQLLYSEASESSRRPENFVAEFSFTTDTSLTIGWITETMIPIVERVPYPEEQIFEKCVIDGDKITIDSNTPFSEIEVLVAMTKRLHMIRYPSENAKWIFTRLDLDRVLEPGDASFMHVELIRNLNNRLTKSDIVSNGKLIGQIYFSMVII